MRIAIIGAGNVGQALATGWLRAGHSVVFGARNPGSGEALELVSRFPGAECGSNSEAVENSDVVVLAVPWDAVPQALAGCGHIGGRVLIDATNPLQFGSEGPELAVGFSDSGGETVARIAPGARVVKTMNQVGFAVMAAAEGYPSKPTMFLASDDEPAKVVACDLVSDLGFDARDAGPLRNARLLEPYAMLWIDQVVNRGAFTTSAFALMQKERQ